MNYARCQNSYRISNQGGGGDSLTEVDTDVWRVQNYSGRPGKISPKKPSARAKLSQKPNDGASFLEL